MTSGLLATPSTLVFAIAVALAVLATTTGRPWERTGRWLALASIGWGAHLQLIEAGPRVTYQHLVFPDVPTSATATTALAVLVAQALIVAVAARPLAAHLLGKLRRRSSPTLLASGCLFLLGVAAVPSADPRIYVTEAIVTLTLQLMHALTVASAVMALPDGDAARLWTWLGRPHARPFPREVWLAAGASTLLAAVLCLVVYENHPHVPDELVYLLPARYFADGRLELAAPPVAAAFELDLMVNDGTRLYSPVPAGWPAVLAIGSFFGVPWLVNPVLGGASVLLTWRLVSSLYDARTARLATLLLASSPWLIFLSMSFMTHLLPLFCALVAAVAVDETRRRRATWPALVGGAALGLIALTRPFDALAAAAATGLWALWTGIPSRRLGPAVALTATSIAVAALTLPYNRHFTGSATQFPLMAYTDVLYGEGTNALGFGANRGLGWPGLDPFPGHGPVDVVVNAMLNLAAINQELFGWGVGSLVLVALLVAGRGMTRTDAAMAGAGGLVIVLHSFYWFAGGPDFAARYWFLTIVPLCVLSARAVVHLEGDGSGASRGRVASAVVALSALSLVVFVPWRSVDKYHDYRGMEPGVRVLDRKIKFGRSLVLVRGNRHPDYASAAFYNPLDWDADAPVYAWDRSPETRREVLAAFPDRPVWVLDGPTVTGGGYRVARGPIAPDSAQRVLLGP